MSLPEIPDFTKHLEDQSSELRLLRQNTLLSESNFISFAKERGIPVDGVVTGAPGELHAGRWLSCDGSLNDTLLFHPFRIYPLFTALRQCKFNIAPTAFLHRDNLKKLVEFLMDALPEIEQLKELTWKSNCIVDLAILLEPLYWPRLTGHTTSSFELSEKQRDELLKQYRNKIIVLVRSLDPTAWEKIHEHLRIDAAQLDNNHELYLLLRLGDWGRRKELKGKTSGALWLRHIAEVIRRAFEEFCNVRWKEEDQAFGWWPPNARLIRYGSERPLDDELQSKPHLAWNYQLLTGSVARWYVEGETEYHAVTHVLPDAARLNIELINLRGNIASGRDNIAMKFKDFLASDKSHKRFSIISFDQDVKENVKFIKRQVDNNNIVGFIAMHTPDFEFANFTVNELAEIAAGIDEVHGFAGDSIRTARWDGINTGRAFEAAYINASLRSPNSLKGEEWGKALAEYAINKPTRSNGAERPFWREIRAGLQARFADYSLHRDSMGFDPQTFELMDKS